MPSISIDDAEVVDLEDGSIHLASEGVRYAKDQFIPFHILGINSSPARHTTAARFVTGTMGAKFSDTHAKWPVMALKFLLSK